MFDLKSSLMGFQQLVTLQLKENPSVHIVPSKMNSDIKENHFCQQRSLYHGSNANPDYHEYSKAQKAIILGQPLPI